jgi:lipopolysaccharide export system protein LptA
MKFVTAGSILCVAAVSLCFAQANKKTVITGDSMEMIDAGKKVVFSGGAKVVHGKDILKADEIIQDKTENTVNAKGNINFQTLVNEDELMTGTAAKMLYNITTESGQLKENRPKLIYKVKTSTQPVTLTADNIDFDHIKGYSNASGNVEIISSSASAYSQRAQFYYKEKKVVLNGGKEQPRVNYTAQGRNDRFYGDVITMFLDKKIMILEGNARGFVKDTKKK